MFEQFFILFLMYAYLFFVGIGCYCFITPKYLQKPFIFPFLSPMYGLILMSIVNIYYLYANINITKSIYPLTIVGVISFFAAVSYKKDVFIDTYKRVRSLSKFEFLKIGLIMVILVIILSPTLRAGYPTTPYRVGIDQAGYAEVAQFLLSGGTYNEAELNIKAEFNEPNLSEALRKEVTALKINSVVDAEFIVDWPRAGYYPIVATLTALVKSEHVYEIEFILLIIPYASIMALGYYLMKYKLNCSSNASYLVAIALAFNCNLLNVYYEGQYAQLFFEPIFILLLISYLSIRESQESFKLKSMFIFNSQYSIIFPSLIIAAIGSCYSESFVLFIGFCAITIIYDFFNKKKITFAPVVTLLASFFAGLFIILPQAYKMIQAMIRLFSRIFSVAGFWQPKWASPIEILGVFNMYTPESVINPCHLLERSTIDFLANVILSVIIIAFVYILMKKNKIIDKSFWLTAPTIILLIYFKTRVIEHIHNYQYMKTYTIFLPLIFVLVFFAIDFVSNLADNRKKIITNTFKYSILSIIIFTGLSYIRQYNLESGYVTKDMYSLTQLNQKVDLNSYAVIIEKTKDIAIKEHMLMPIIPFNWLNYSDHQYVNPFLSKKVGILVDRSKLKCSERFIEKYSDKILYSNPSYIFVDTKLRLIDVYNFKTSDVDWKRILSNYAD